MRGRTALMHACAAPFHQNHPEVVQMLLAKGADVNAKDKRGVKALDYARSREVKDLLIKAGAK